MRASSGAKKDSTGANVEYTTVVNGRPAGKKWCIAALFALYLNPVILGSASTACYLFLYGSAAAYIIVNSIVTLSLIDSLREHHIYCVLGICFLLLASVSVPVLYRTFDYSYVTVLLGVVRRFLILLFLMVLVKEEYPDGDVLHLFMYYFSAGTCLYVIGSCLFMAFPSLRQAWASVIQEPESSERLYDSYGYVARFGWSGFSGFRKTMDCSVSVMFLLCIYSEQNSESTLSKRMAVALLVICLIGNIFYGRSGMAVSAICLIIWFLFGQRLRVRDVVALVVVLLVFAVSMHFLRSANPVLGELYNWAMTPFINLFTTGHFNNYSVDNLTQKMIFMPSTDTLIHGDGMHMQNGHYYMNTDSGFMRQILFWGLPMTIITYILTLLPLESLRREHGTLCLMLLISFVLFEFKGETYYELMPLILLIDIVDWNLRTRPAPADQARSFQTEEA